MGGVRDGGDVNRPPATFDEAVALARALLEHARLDDAKASHRGLAASVRLKRCAPGGLWWVDPDTPPETARAAQQGPAFAALLDAAPSDPVAHDAVTQAAAGLLRARLPMAPALADWTAAHVAGGAPRPPNPRSGDGAQEAEHGRIARAVWVLVRLGMKARTGEARAGKPPDQGGDSACHAVARALAEMGRRPASYHHVAAIWKDAREWRKRMDSHRFIAHALELDLGPK